MFTGLVETLGRVVTLDPRADSTRLTLTADLGPDGTEVGASVAVDGVCLTVAERAADRLTACVIAETLARSTLGALRPRQPVNLERALRVGDRLGGHLVLGHVDAVVRVGRVSRSGSDRRLELELPPELSPYVARKGSIALHGVSLTVSARTPRSFEVALVPHTLEHTTLGTVRVGDRLNVEVDLIARYLETLVPAQRATDP